MGFGQFNVVLWEYNSILEIVLVKREVDLVQLNFQVQVVLQCKEEEDCQMKQFVQVLQVLLEKEKEKVNSFKEQVVVVKVEVGYNCCYFKVVFLELSEVKKELQVKEYLVQKLQVEVDDFQIWEGKYFQEIVQF